MPGREIKRSQGEEGEGTVKVWNDINLDSGIMREKIICQELAVSPRPSIFLFLKILSITASHIIFKCILDCF